MQLSKRKLVSNPTVINSDNTYLLEKIYDHKGRCIPMCYDKGYSAYNYLTKNADYTDLFKDYDSALETLKENRICWLGITHEYKNRAIVDIDVPMGVSEVMDIVNKLECKPTLITQNKVSLHWQFSWNFVSPIQMRGKFKNGYEYTIAKNVQKYKEICAYLNGMVGKYVDVDRACNNDFGRNYYSDSQITHYITSKYDVDNMKRVKCPRERYSKVAVVHDGRHNTMLSYLDSWGLSIMNEYGTLTIDDMTDKAFECNAEISELCGKKELMDDDEVIRIAENCFKFVKKNWNKEYRKGNQASWSKDWNVSQHETKCKKVRDNIRLFRRYFKGGVKLNDLVEFFKVSRQTVYKYIEYAKQYLFELKMTLKQEKAQWEKCFAQKRRMWFSPMSIWKRKIDMLNSLVLTS